MMQPGAVTAGAEGPINDLVFALDHYFVVGEQLGEGVGAESPDGEWIVFLAVNPKEPSDVRDLERVRARLAEIAATDGIKTRIERMGADARFTVYWLYAPKDRSRELCRRLMLSAGAAGWGGFLSKMGVLDQAALHVARCAGVALQSVQSSTAAAIRLDLGGVVSPEVLEVGLHETGETGEAVRFWHARGEYYLDDPTFIDRPVEFRELAYSAEIGLHVRDL